MAGAPGPCGCGCALTPDTSYGFDVVDWATTVLLYPPDPWQRWALIHGLELLPDGRPRFRTLLIEVARQSGKTTLLVILSAWWQFVCDIPLILGTSTKLDYAKESWHRQVEVVEAAPALSAQRPRRWTRDTNGEQESWTVYRARYKIAASNEEGGRSLTVHRLILDELRQHHNYSAWGASVNAGQAVDDFQVWGLSNAGSDRSVVMNELHDAAERFLEWATSAGPARVAELAELAELALDDDAVAEMPGDYRTGMFSWSAPPDAEPTDRQALALANPNMNRPHGIRLATLLGQARQAVAAGGAALDSFKTEAMCIRVRNLNSALDLTAWARGLEVATLDAYRGRIALLFDVAPDLGHAVLVAAAVQTDGRVRVEVVASWDSVHAAGKAVAGWVERVRPYVLGWFPGGPAAAVATELADGTKRGRRGWPPRGTRLEPIKAELPAVCMGYAELVHAGQVVHSGQQLLDDHAANAEKRPVGQQGQWIFDRMAGAGHVTGTYGAAGAAHLARTIPAPREPTSLRVLRD